MWRIEYNELKRTVRKGHISKVGDHIGVNLQLAAVTEDVFFIPNVSEQHVRILLVKPKHSATTAGIKYFLVGCHLSSFCAPEGTV